MIQVLILIVLCIAFGPAILSFLGFLLIATVAIIAKYWLFIVAAVGLAIATGVLIGIFEYKSKAK